MKRPLIVLALVLGLGSASHAAPVLVEVTRILPVFAAAGSTAAAASSIGSAVRLTYSASVEKNEQTADKVTRARNYYALSALFHTASAFMGIKSFKASDRVVDLELQRRAIWALFGGMASNLGTLATSLADWQMIPPGGSANIAGPTSSIIQMLPGAVACIARIFV